MSIVKYKDYFAIALLNGLRRQGFLDEATGKEYSWSVERVCEHWGISVNTYNQWREKYKAFDKAAEKGDQDYKLYWIEKLEDPDYSRKMHPTIVKLIMANVLGYTDRQKDVKQEVEPPRTISKIEISVAPQLQKNVTNDNIKCDNVIELKTNSN